MADTIYVVQSPVIRTVEVIGQKSLQTIEAIKQGPPGIPHRYTELARTLSIPANLVSVELLPVNRTRLAFSIYNNSTDAILKVAFGEIATNATFSHLLYPDDTLVWDTVMYTGPIYGYWNLEQGTAQVLELYSPV
jgi:hypothetical protein